MTTAVQSLWRAARGRLVRLNQLLAEAAPLDDAIFEAPREPERTDDVERRIAEARQARMSRKERRPSA